MFSLPDLPYAYDALAPVMSERTLHFHHDKHHATYIKTLNELLEAAGNSHGALEQVIAEAARADERKLFNNAAQAWNHSFFWAAMSARAETPAAALAEAIDGDFGGLDGLKQAFVKAGAEQFGSGWVWLDADRTGALQVRTSHDAENPLVHPEVTPLLVCDLWEHAYYLDHQNDRKGFLEAWFDALPHWEFAGLQFEAARGRGEPWRHPLPTAARQPQAAQAG